LLQLLHAITDDFVVIEERREDFGGGKGEILRMSYFLRELRGIGVVVVPGCWRG
jgi:hypothetical protein